MDYTTTKLQQLKSYPTYQFHSLVKSGTLAAEDIFKICILETFAWMRERLSNYKTLPTEVVMPEPVDFKNMSLDRLHSFVVNTGLVIDVVYVEKKGLWSFCLTEPDMGANPGTPDERKPVFGRTFSTEISFIIGEKEVEAGVRIICSEPVDCDQSCEGFRPAIVRALFDNDKLFFECENYKLDDKPVLLQNKSALGFVGSMLANPNFDLPIVFVAEGAYPKEEKKDVIFENVLASLGAPAYMTGSIWLNGNDPKYEKLTNKIQESQKVEKKRQQTVNYATLAKSFVAQAIVVFVEGQYYGQLMSKHGIFIEDGMIVAARKGKVLFSYRDNDYSGGIPEFEKKLKKKVRAIPKHQNYFFGNIGRHSDAKLIEVQLKRNASGTYESEIERLNEENRLLSAKIDELSQQETDRNGLMEDMQQYKRNLKDEKRLNESLQDQNKSLNDQVARSKEALERANAIVKFYDKQWKLAVEFPTEKSKIPGWIRKTFSDTIYLTKRAETSLDKYEGQLKFADFCDAIVYLDAYGRFKQGKLDNEGLSIYSARNGWNPEGCGKESMQMRRDDYTVNYEGKSGIMNLHLKSGVSNGELMRIYFLWDDEMKKVVIGYMPGHLATRKKGT